MGPQLRLHERPHRARHSRRARRAWPWHPGNQHRHLRPGPGPLALRKRHARSAATRDMGTTLPASYTIYDKSEVWAKVWITSTNRPSANAGSPPPTSIGRTAWRSLRGGRARHRPVGHRLQLQRPHRAEDHLQVVRADQLRLPRCEALPRHPGLRCRPQGGSPPQARPVQRRRPRPAPLGALYRGWYGALKFTEMMIAARCRLQVVRDHPLRSWRRLRPDRRGSASFTNYMARDSRRHLEYGRRHLLWYIQHHPRGRRTSNSGSAAPRAPLSIELHHSHPEREAAGRASSPTALEKVRPASTSSHRCARSRSQTTSRMLDERWHRPAARYQPGPAAVCQRPPRRLSNW